MIWEKSWLGKGHPLANCEDDGGKARSCFSGVFAVAESCTDHPDANAHNLKVYAGDSFALTPTPCLTMAVGTCETFIT